MANFSQVKGNCFSGNRRKPKKSKSDSEPI